MRAPEMQTARLPEPFARGGEGTFHALSSRAPFPRSGGGCPPCEARFGPRIEIELEIGPSAAAEARAAAAALEGEASADVIDDIRLLLSEVVTNAVRHSEAPNGSHIGLCLRVVHDVVRVEVMDQGGGFDPTPRTLPHLEAGGWGLHLVDRLAGRWGVERQNGVCVWFEVDSDG